MNHRNKKYINFALLSLCLVLIAIFFRKPTVDGDFSYYLKMQSIEANKAAPFMVDENQRFDSAASTDKTMIYTFTLINAVKDGADLVLFKIETEAHLRNTSCKNEGIKQDLIRGASYKYMFLDKNGELLLSTILTKDECKLA